MRVKINLDTMKDINDFVRTCTSISVPVHITDGAGLKVSGKSLLGVMYAMNSLGLCLGSPIGDLYYDVFGTYKPCFWIFSILLVVVAIGYCFVIRAAYKEKNAIIAASSN